MSRKKVNGFSLSLTAREHAFVQEYLKCGKVQEAAEKAGYSKSSAHAMASRLLKKPAVIAAIEKSRKKVADKTVNTLADRIQTAQTILNRCMQVEPVLDRDGNAVMCEDAEGNLRPAYIFKPKEALGANEQLIKLAGYYAPEKKELSGNINVSTFDISRLSDAEKDQLWALLEKIS